MLQTPDPNSELLAFSWVWPINMPNQQKEVTDLRQQNEASRLMQKLKDAQQALSAKTWKIRSIPRTAERRAKKLEVGC